MELIPTEIRKNLRCHFCGETRSVKYLVEVFDPVLDNKPQKVACCNRCVLFYGEQKQDENNFQDG